MKDLGEYFFTNFFLICLSLGVIVMVLRSYRTKRVAVLMPILIVSSALVLSIAYAIEQFAMKNGLEFLAIFCFFLGFAIRPIVLLFFLRMVEDKKIILWICIGLTILNGIVYSFSLFLFAPDFSHLVYWNVVNADGTLTGDHRGPLYYFSYFIVGAMVIYLIFTSVRMLKGRHRYDALASLICVAFIGISVLVETVLFRQGLLNTTIAIACLFFIVHLYQQASNRDGLTGLFERKTLYADIAKSGPRIKGLILVDMNSLKLINDTQGHEAGDKAILSIARTLEKLADDRSTYVYRLGGDEFLVVSYSNKEKILENACDTIRAEMAKTPYSVSLGSAYREKAEDTYTEMYKRAEDMMYADKAAYYEASGIERRKQ